MSKSKPKENLKKIKNILKESNISSSVLLPPGFKTKKNRSKNTTGLIKRRGKPVKDAKYDVDFWNKYDQIVFVNKEQAEKMLRSKRIPELIKRIIIYNFDKFEKNPFSYNQKCISINIGQALDDDLAEDLSSVDLEKYVKN